MTRKYVSEAYSWLRCKCLVHHRTSLAHRSEFCSSNLSFGSLQIVFPTRVFRVSLPHVFRLLALHHFFSQLYARRVFILDDCDELMPRLLNTVMGVVDPARRLPGHSVAVFSLCLAFGRSRGFL